MRGIPPSLFAPHDFDSSLGFLIIIVVILVSMVCLCILARGANVWFSDYALAILRRISPPDPVIGEDFVVLLKENVYTFFIKSAPGLLYFVSFKHLDPTPAEDIDVPKLFWRWQSTLHINGLRAHDKYGHFSVPTPEGSFISGEGLLLAVSIYGRSYLLRVPEFSREQLLSVVDYASAMYSHTTR